MHINYGNYIFTIKLSLIHCLDKKNNSNDTEPFIMVNTVILE